MILGAVKLGKLIGTAIKKNKQKKKAAAAQKEAQMAAAVAKAVTAAMGKRGGIRR